MCGAVRPVQIFCRRVAVHAKTLIRRGCVCLERRLARSRVPRDAGELPQRAVDAFVVCGTSSRPGQLFRRTHIAVFPGRFASRSHPGVVLDDATEPLTAPDRASDNRPGPCFRSPAHRRGEPQRRMGPLPVVVIDVLSQEVVQVPGADHHEVVEALRADALDQALNVGIHVR